MGRGPTKSNENAYFVARKKAAMYNERLYSREGAAELLGISVSTLADYELGNTKVVPVDKVVLMADLYNAPELKTGYCKYECPICSYLPVATEAKGLEVDCREEMFFLVTGIQHSIVEMERLYMRASMRKEPRQEEKLETKQVEKFASGVIIISHGSMFTDIPEKPAMLVQ